MKREREGGPINEIANCLMTGGTAGRTNGGSRKLRSMAPGFEKKGKICQGKKGGGMELRG